MKTSALSQYSNNLVIKTNAQWWIEEIWPAQTAFFKQTEKWLNKPIQQIIIFSEQEVFMNELKKFKLSNNKTESFQTFILNEKKKKFAAELIIQKKFKAGKINHFIINVQQIQALQSKPKSFPVPLLLRETILDNIHAAILILNKNAEITYLNKAGERITGYNFATIANKNWFQLFVPENERKQTIAIFQKLKSGVESIDHENAIITKQKNTKIIQWKNTAIYSGKTFQGTLSIGIDVTELKNANEAIKQSERKFQSITEAIPIGLTICEVNGNVLYMNKAFRQIFGYKVSEIKSVHDWFNKAYPNKTSAEKAKKSWNNHVKSLQDKPIEDTIELKLLTQKRKEKIIELKTTYNNGYIYQIFIDLTEKRKLESEAKEQALKFKRIIENFPIPMASCDLNYDLLFTNNKFEEVFGYKMEEIKKYPAWFKKIKFNTPEDEAKHDEEFYGYLKATKSNPDKIAPVLYRQIYNKKGDLRDINITFNLFDNELFAVLEDVTEQNKYIKLLQESEERFKALAQNMPIAIGSYNTDGSVNFINQYFIKTIGYTPEELPTIEAWYAKTQPDPIKRQQYYQHWVSLIEAFSKNPQQEIPYVESDITCKDGSIKTFSYLFSIYKKTVYIIFVDITERRKAEKELMASHIQLQRLSAHQRRTKEAERKYIAEYIHDTVSQPVTGIKIDLTVIKNKLLKTQPELADKLQHNIEIANQVILSTRKMATDLRPSILDDFGLAAAIEWECREFEKKTGILCYFEYDNSLKEESSEIQSNLYRIVQEALNNIDKFSQATKITIELYKKDNNIHLCISDNGNGHEIEEKLKTLAIIGIKDRARNLKGSFSIEPNKNREGSQLVLTIPLKTHN